MATQFSTTVLALLSITTMLLQAATPIASPEVSSFLGQAEHLTLIGALAMAVVVLWKQNGRANEQLLKSAETTQQALSLAAKANEAAAETAREQVSSNEALTHPIEVLVQTIQELRIAIGRLPCSEVLERVTTDKKIVHKQS